MKTLKQIIEEENLCVNTQSIGNYGTDKDVHPYVENVYEPIFSKLQNDNLLLVEIGVRGGASIHLWRKYFKNAKIYGIDNLESTEINGVPVNPEWINGKDVEIVIGDAYSKEIVNKIPDNIDILIDDGPHTFDSHVKLLELYLPKMNKNGMLIIEDIMYDINSLYSYVPDNLKENSSFYDFNGYYAKLFLIRIK